MYANHSPRLTAAHETVAATMLSELVRAGLPFSLPLGYVTGSMRLQMLPIIVPGCPQEFTVKVQVQAIIVDPPVVVACIDEQGHQEPEVGMAGGVREPVHAVQPTHSGRT